MNKLKTVLLILAVACSLTHSSLIFEETAVRNLASVCCSQCPENLIRNSSSSAPTRLMFLIRDAIINNFTMTQLLANLRKFPPFYLRNLYNEI